MPSGLTRGFAPLEGRRWVEVKVQRTAKDYARVLKDLSDVHFAKAGKITLVQDNLNTRFKRFEPLRAIGL